MQEIPQLESPPLPQVEAGPRKKSLLREILETVLLALLIFAALRLAVQNFRIQGQSMEPSLHNGQFLVVNRLPYYLHGPQRGEVIVFLTPQAPAEPCASVVKRFAADMLSLVGRNNPCEDLIKRVMGLPGEEVEIRDGKVYINGVALSEPYVTEDWDSTWGPQVLGANQYFVLGDNRNDSSDSRQWGMVPRENIVGQAWLSYWPPAYWGLVPQFSF